MKPKQIVPELVQLERTLSDDLGPFHVFAFLKPEVGHGWDLLFVSNWADRLGELEAVRLMVAKLREIFDEPTVRLFWRVLNFSVETSALSELYRDYPVEHDLIEIEDEDILGLMIHRGYIITCKDRPVEKPAPRAKVTKKKQPVAVA